MGYGTLVYNLTAAAAGSANVDMTAATDSDFSQRNGHYIFTVPYRLHSAALVGASVQRGRFQAPTWNAIGEFALFNANRALQPPSNPQWDLWAPYPPALPLNEEFQVQASNNLGMGTEIENCVLNLITDDFTQNLPRGRFALCVRATLALTPTLNAWSGPQALTFIQGLRGGVYAVVGCVVQGTNAVAWRLVFPRYRLYHGQKLRPGGLIQTALADVISNQHDPWNLDMGELGRFHTFEPVQIELFGTLAGAITYQVFLWLVFLGEDLGLINQGMGGGM